MTSVGGTSLYLNTAGKYLSETVWNDSIGAGGGGISQLFREPDYQQLSLPTLTQKELGGMRGIFHYMQRTAIQASPARLASLLNAWSRGAAEVHTDAHPFRHRYDELVLGETIRTGTRTITLEDIEHFARFTGDTFYAHMDEEAAKANPFFPGRVAHGYLLLSFAAGLFVEPAPGPVLANYGLDNLRFFKPVVPGDTIEVRLTVKQKAPRKPEYGEVRWDVEITNQNGETVASYELLTMNATELGAAQASLAPA